MGVGRGVGGAGDWGLTDVHGTSRGRCVGKSRCLGSRHVDPVGGAGHAPSLSFLPSSELLATPPLFPIRKGRLAAGLGCDFVLLPRGLFCFKKKTRYAFAFFTGVLSCG